MYLGNQAARLTMQGHTHLKSSAGKKRKKGKKEKNKKEKNGEK